MYCPLLNDFYLFWTNKKRFSPYRDHSLRTSEISFYWSMILAERDNIRTKQRSKTLESQSGLGIKPRSQVNHNMIPAVRNKIKSHSNLYVIELQ